MTKPIVYQFNLCSSDKNDVSESLTELRVKACTCLDKQIDVW